MKNYHSLGPSYDLLFKSKKIRKSKKKKAKKSKNKKSKKQKKTSNSRSNFWNELLFRTSHIAVNRMFDMIENKKKG